MAEEIHVENERLSNSEGLVTSTFVRSYGYSISFKSDNPQETFCGQIDLETEQRHH